MCRPQPLHQQQNKETRKRAQAHEAAAASVQKKKFVLRPEEAAVAKSTLGARVVSAVEAPAGTVTITVSAEIL